jgi:hypothetical protein
MTESRLTIAEVRVAAAARVKDTSLREVADEIGMSFSGLKSFIDGGSPHRRTRTELFRWYYQRTKRVPSPPKEDRESALAVLRTYVSDTTIPAAVRERRLREVIDLLNEPAE